MKQSEHRQGENGVLLEDVLLEIGAAKLQYLLSAGHICAADIRCVNRDSKRVVKALCIKACVKRLGQVNQPEAGCCWEKGRNMGRGPG